MTLMITAAIISKRVPSTIKKKVTSPQKPSCCDSSPAGAAPRPFGRPRPSPGIFIILRSIVILVIFSGCSFLAIVFPLKNASPSAFFHSFRFNCHIYDSLSSTQPDLIDILKPTEACAPRWQSSVSLLCRVLLNHQSIMSLPDHCLGSSSITPPPS